MTKEQKNKIRKLREKGFGYKLIAKELGISANSVKSFCRRNELFEPNGQTTSAHCEQCGKELVHTPKKKKKRFCSDISMPALYSHNQVHPTRCPEVDNDSLLSLSSSNMIN